MKAITKFPAGSVTANRISFFKGNAIILGNNFTAKIKTDLTSEGAYNFKKFNKVIASYSTLSNNENDLIFKDADGAKVTMSPTHEILEWEVPEVTGNNSVTIALQDLREAFEYVAPSISTELSRQYLNCVYADFSKNQMVATDGRKLSLYPLSFEGIANGGLSIERSAMEYIMAVTEKTMEEFVKIAWDDSHIIVTLQECGIVLNVYNSMGTFPNYNQAIPKENSASFYFFEKDIDKLAKFCKKTAGLNKNQDIFGVFSFTEKTVNITTEVDEIGNVEFSIPVQKMTGKFDEDMGLNLSFLYDLLSVTKGRVVIHTGYNALAPVKIETEKGFSLVMPRKL